MGQPTDYEPLLPRGFHVVTLETLRALCVTPFESQSRPRLMTALESLHDRIAAVGVPAELWINGSFLVADPEPNDIDAALVLPYYIRSSGSPAVAELLKWLREESRQQGLDVYLLTSHPEGAGMHPAWAADREHFEGMYGQHYNADQPKGIAVLAYRGGAGCRT